MVPTLVDRPARPGQPHRRPLHQPKVGDVVVFHPPEGAEQRQHVRRQPAARTASPARSPSPSARTSTSSSASWPARATACDRGRPRHPQRQAPAEPFTGPAAAATDAITRADHDSRRSLLHDGRQPWLFRRQPILGTRSRGLDHRRRLRDLLASEAHRPPLSEAASVAQAQPIVERPAVRVRPRARLPVRRGRGRGRPRLPGRAAGRRRGAVRLRAPVAARPALAVRAQRLQAAHARDARGALPARAARRGASRSPRAACAGSTSAGCTRRTSRRCATRCAGSACAGCMCLSDGFPVPPTGFEQRPVVGGDATRPRSPPPP